MQRVRTTDDLSKALVNSVVDDNELRAYWMHDKRLLGHGKVTVDNPRPLRDYRYDFIPTVKTRLYKRRSYLPTTYKGKDPSKRTGKRVKSFVTRTYTKFISLKRPKGLRVDNALVRLNEFQIASVKGYCTSGYLATFNLPPGWTTWKHTGPIACDGWGSPDLQYYMNIDPYDLTRPLELDLAYAETALTRASAKVQQPDVDFAEILGEFDQLVKLLKDPSKTLSSLLRKFQRYYSADAWVLNPKYLPTMGKGKLMRLAYNTLDSPTLLSAGLSLFTFRTRRKVGRIRVTSAAVTEAANRWLQYRYGVVPLIGDITEIIRKFSDTIKPLVKVYVAKATVVSNRKTTVWTETRGSVLPGMTITYRFSVSVFDRTTAKVYYRLNLLDKFVDLRDLGLDKSNLIPVIHELGPWSFVVDWFYGIGDWLRCWNVDPKLDIIANCVSRKRDMNVKIEMLSATYQGYPCQVTPSRLYVHRAELCRKVNQPVPKYPVFNPDYLRWRRVVDSISLLWAKMPSLRR